MNKIGVTYHPKSELAKRCAADIYARLTPLVAETWIASAWDDMARDEHIPGTDLLLTCGGDGTVLRAARAVIPHPVVLLGVNLGRVGFLTEITPEALMPRIEEIVAGTGRIEPRAMIETATIRSGEEVRDGFFALNDVVIGRRAIGRTVQFSVRGDGTTIGNYRADGVIVASATGSTAYTLSVGGPILHPESQELIMTPVAPHLSPANSVILPNGALVEVEIAQGQSAILSVDGQPDMDLSGGDIVRVKTSAHTARFLRLGPAGDFYLRVGRRLNWLTE